jgi:hypothetical protein
MKRFAIASLSILCLSLIATTSIKAENKTGNSSMLATTMNSNAQSPKITPFELVSRAYQGSYQMQNIPSFGSFLTASSSKMITAKDIIKAAIDAKQLDPETQADRNYINDVDLHLLGGQD